MSNCIEPSQRGPDRVGHDLLWAHVLSRRQLLRATAGAAGVIATSPLWTASLAFADEEEGLATVAPKPIPGGITVPVGPGFPIHHFPPTPVLGALAINEPSQITDFDGWVGITRVKGAGTATDTETQVQTRLNFRVDNGFMSGRYVGEDGHVHRGTFAFV